jgi:uncharacterized protein YcbK (DUF882 family)
MRVKTDWRAQPLAAVTSRRAALKAGLGVAAALAAPAPVWARGLAVSASRELSFLNLHTGERLRVEYFHSGKYVPDALRAVSVVLRDHRTNATHPIDPQLLDLIHVLRAKLRSAAAFDVISGYRSPQSNALMHEASAGVAAHSLHMEGRAIDIRLPGTRLGSIKKAALAMKMGGVGYYPEDDFVHVDTGAVRHWGS